MLIIPTKFKAPSNFSIFNALTIGYIKIQDINIDTVLFIMYPGALITIANTNSCIATNITNHVSSFIFTTLLPLRIYAMIAIINKNNRLPLTIPQL